MNKIFFYFIISIFSSYSQYDNINVNDTKNKILSKACYEPFVILGQYFNSEINILKFKSNFYFRQTSDDQILFEIICDGKNICNINYEYEEISIYSLTEKEKENCYFIDQIFNRIENWEIQENINLIKSMDNWFIMNEFFNEKVEKGAYNNENLNEKYKISGNINLIWIEENPDFFSQYLPNGYILNINTKQLLKENSRFELIDLR